MYRHTYTYTHTEATKTLGIFLGQLGSQTRNVSEGSLKQILAIFRCTQSGLNVNNLDFCQLCSWVLFRIIKVGEDRRHGDLMAVL